MTSLFRGKESEVWETALEIENLDRRRECIKIKENRESSHEIEFKAIAQEIERREEMTKLRNLRMIVNFAKPLK